MINKILDKIIYGLTLVILIYLAGWIWAIGSASGLMFVKHNFPIKFEKFMCVNKADGN